MKSFVCLLLGIYVANHSIIAFQRSSECGKTVGCFSDCATDCTFEVTWKDTTDKVEISIKAALPVLSSNGEWVALGLSNDQQMGDDKVFDCITDGTNTFVQYSRNNASPKFNQLVSKSPTWVTVKSRSYTNGVLMCTFEATKSNSAGINFDTDWYFLLGKGPWGATNTMRKHTTTPKISASVVDFQSFEDIGSSSQGLMLKLHGTMMIAAWVLCASIGVVIARYYKPVWLEEKMCGEKVWFSIHRGIMILAVMFCIAGFVIIFVKKGTFEEVESDSNFKKAHPFIGIIVMGLAIIQPAMAFCRPHPGEKNRFIFNWAHWGVGIICHFLAVLNILIGVLLDAMELPIWVVYVVIAYAIYQFVIEFFLEIYDCFSRRKKPSENYEMREDNSVTRDNNQDSEYKFKKFILGLHIVIIIGFTTALIVMVFLDLSEHVDD